MNRFVAGGCAGFVAQSAIYPLEITKTRLALANAGQYKGIADCMKHIVKTDGFRGLYSGWNASVLGIVPYAGVELTLYNIMKEQIADYRKIQYSQNINDNRQYMKPPCPSALEILTIGSLASASAFEAASLNLSSSTLITNTLDGKDVSAPIPLLV